MLDALTQDYVRTARAKGLRERVVLIAARAPQHDDPGHHRARACSSGNCSAAPSSPRPSLPGRVSGQLAIESIRNADFPVTQAAVVLARDHHLGWSISASIWWSASSTRESGADALTAEEDQWPPQTQRIQDRGLGVLAHVACARRRCASGCRPPGSCVCRWPAGSSLLILIFIADLRPAADPLHVPRGPHPDRLQQPVWQGGSWSHPLGTDGIGRDYATRLMYGARIALVGRRPGDDHLRLHRHHARHAGRLLRRLG